MRKPSLGLMQNVARFLQWKYFDFGGFDNNVARISPLISISISCASEHCSCFQQKSLYEWTPLWNNSHRGRQKIILHPQQELTHLTCITMELICVVLSIAWTLKNTMQSTDMTIIWIQSDTSQPTSTNNKYTIRVFPRETWLTDDADTKVTTLNNEWNCSSHAQEQRKYQQEHCSQYLKCFLWAVTYHEWAISWQKGTITVFSVMKTRQKKTTP